jgi:hypothetical protein
VRDIIVTMQDVREIKLCAGGARAFAKQAGLDWPDFLENGIPASKLLATNNDFAARAVENARKRWEAAKLKP